VFSFAGQLTAKTSSVWHAERPAIDSEAFPMRRSVGQIRVTIGDASSIEMSGKPIRRQKENSEICLVVGQEP
jgi:hypothetical protein